LYGDGRRDNGRAREGEMELIKMYRTGRILMGCIFEYDDTIQIQGRIATFI